jgi:fructose-1,6-bisphosphatase/inositol monophosphatase family enzyme
VQPRRNYSIEDLIEVGTHATKTVVQRVIEDVEREPAAYLSRQKSEATGKAALRIDLDAEDTFERVLHGFRNGSFKSIVMLGEERLTEPSLDLSAEKGVVALVDAVDGTDLLERGLGNWCCASLFFQPSKPAGSRILGAFVGLPNRNIYYASDAEEGVLVTRPKQRAPVAVRGTSGLIDISKASAYFYGQKVKNLLKTIQKLGPAFGSSPDFRVYTLAGIPMMARLVDHVVRGARGIDVVFELLGQQPHDAVPGLYLAHKAGAHIVDLKGNPLALTTLEDALLRPGSGRLQYVAAATPELASAFLSMLRSSSTAQRADNASRAR